MYSSQTSQQIIYDYLNAQNIIYDLVHTDDAQVEATVCASCVLQDHKKFVVFFLKNSFVEPSHFDFLNQSQIQVGATSDILPGSSIRLLPALANLFQNIPIYLDQGILPLKWIYLEVGYEEMCIKLSGQDYQKTFSQVEVCHIKATEQVDKLCELYDTEKVGSDSRFLELRLRQKSKSVNQLPLLPHTAKQLLKLRSDRDASVKKLAKIVELDPSLSVQIVSWAASPYYGYAGEINSVEDAILKVIGFDLVLNLALGIALSRVFDVTHYGPIGLRAYWQEAITTAWVCESTAIQEGTKSNPAHMYLIGLIHSIGKLILGHTFPLLHTGLNNLLVLNPHIPGELFERYLFGFGLESLAAEVLTEWQLPKMIITCIQQQRCSERSSQFYNEISLIQRGMIISHYYHGRSASAEFIEKITNHELEPRFKEEQLLMLKEQAPALEKLLKTLMADNHV